MGLYIEDQKILSKQEWLVVNGRRMTAAEILLGHFNDFRQNKMFPVALIDNLAFYAAGVCFNKMNGVDSNKTRVVDVLFSS